MYIGVQVVTCVVYDIVCMITSYIMYINTSYRVKQAVAKKDEAMKSLRTQHEVRRYIYLNNHVKIVTSIVTHACLFYRLH